MANGRFDTKELTFKVSGNEFVVGCGATGRVFFCGQQTAKSLVQPLGDLDNNGLEQLKDQLRTALAQLGG